MRNMKDSGVEWLESIPETWNLLQLGSLFSEHKHKNIGMQSSNLLSLSYGNIIRKNINATDGLLPESFEGYNVIDAGDIVLRLTDLQNDQRSLRVGLCGENGIITSAYTTLRRRNDAISSKYFYYLLHSYDVRKGFYGMGAGVRQGLNYAGVRKIMLAVPSEREQTAIAECLDQKIAQVDALITNVQAQIEKLKAYKQSLITEVVTKGLDPNAPMKDSGVEWIGKIPAHWSILRFKNIADIKSNLVNPKDYMDYFQVSPENIEKGSGKLLTCITVREIGVESNNHLFHKGQIIYSKVRPLLNKVAIAPFDGLCSADMYPVEAKINKKFLVYSMLSDSFLNQVKLVTENRVKMPKINQEELSKIKVCCPEDSEQKRIADYLDAKCSQIDRLISLKESKIEKLQQYKRSLIYEYVTGKKEVV